MNTIRKVYLVNFLNGLVFWYGIEKLYMRSIGIDALGVSIIVTELLIITLLFDVPSGILADRWSRKYTLILGILCLFLATLIYGQSTNLTYYILGTIPYGLYLVFLSGTFGAITYDALKEKGEEKEYSKVQGFAYGLFCTGMFIASIISGVLATYTSFRFPYHLSLISIILAGLVLLSIKEPTFHKSETKPSLFGHFKESFQIIGSQPFLLYIALIAITLNIINNLQTEYGSLYYIGLGLSTSLIGAAYGFQSLARALGQVFSHKIGKKALHYLPLLVIGLALLSFIPSIAMVPVFFITVFIVATIENQVDTSIQEATPSHARATIGSWVNFSANSFLIPIGLVFGWIARNSTIFHSFQLVFLLSIIGYVFLIIREKRHPKPETS